MLNEFSTSPIFDLSTVMQFLKEYWLHNWKKNGNICEKKMFWQFIRAKQIFDCNFFVEVTKKSEKFVYTLHTYSLLKWPSVDHLHISYRARSYWMTSYVNTIHNSIRCTYFLIRYFTNFPKSIVWIDWKCIVFTPWEGPIPHSSRVYNNKKQEQWFLQQ